jgi:hypothetical protein
MKRFLILSILIVFLTVSCAGPNKVRYRIPDYLQNEFENDQKECSDSIDKNLNSEDFGKALEECLGKKGYEFTTVEEGEKPPSVGKIVLTIAALIVVIPLAAALIALQVLGGGGGFHGH